jgi:hypothetical protein
VIRRSLSREDNHKLIWIQEDPENQGQILFPKAERRAFKDELKIDASLSQVEAQKTVLNKGQK